QTSTLTFTITNPAGAPATTGITFTDSFLGTLAIAATPNVVNGCGGTPTITAAANSGVFTIGGTGVVTTVGPSTCTISVDVTSNTAGSYPNGSAQISGLASLNNSVTTQTLTVFAPPNLTVLKSASPTSANPGQEITYTVVVTNTGSGPAISVELFDPISPYTAWKIGSFTFTDGSPASGFSALGTPDYSSTNGLSWGYTPAAGSGGMAAAYDGLVTNWRIPMTGTMNASGKFTITYTVVVK